MRPLHVEADGTLWASRGLRLFRSADNGETFAPLAAYRGNFSQRVSRWSRLVARLRRAGFHTLVPLEDGACIATVQGAILKRDVGAPEFKEVFRIRRGSRPLNICRLPDGRLLWGEYFFNSQRDEVHIYASGDGGETWEVAHTFGPGEVRHVHGIFYDRFRGGCWILTGDDDHECKLLFTSGELKDMEPVFEGSQQFRTVSIVAHPEFLIAGTDSPFEQNYIQRLVPETGEASRVQPVPGSIFDVRAAGGWMVASVAVEPSKVNTGRFASLWLSRDGEHWHEFYRARKDIWQTPYCWPVPDHIAELPFFQHGAFVLPAGENGRPLLYAYGQALSGHDDQMLSWDLDREGPELSSGPEA